MVGKHEVRGCWAWWRLLLVLIPPLVAAGSPWLLVVAYRERLPDRAYVHGWARLGPEHAGIVPTWDAWAAGFLICVIVAIPLALAFVRVRRWPGLQRLLVAQSWGLSAPFAGEALVVVSSRLDTPPASSATPGWGGLVVVALIPVAGVFGWWLAGPVPEGPTRAAAPPAGLPRLALGPAARAVFSGVVWAPRLIAAGCVVLVVALLMAVVKGEFASGPLLFAGLGVLLLLQSWARVQVDMRGVCLMLPLLGRLRRWVLFDEIAFAEVNSRRARSGWFPVVDDSRVGGYLAHSGPALVLHLVDGREFVVTIPSAESAAALVNGELDRLRGGDVAVE